MLLKLPILKTKFLMKKLSKISIFFILMFAFYEDYAQCIILDNTNTSNTPNQTAPPYASKNGWYLSPWVR